MRQIYQGLVSNPNNAIDNAQNISITHTFGGTPVVTVPEEKEEKQPVAEIYMNEACTTLWDGSAQETLYVKLYRSFGFDEGEYWGQDLEIICPSTEYPTDPYVINAYIDWTSGDIEGPLEPGVYSVITTIGYEISNPQVVFYDEE